MHLDIGGEGRYPGAVNVNPWSQTSTTGEPGRPIPDLVMGRGEALPFRSAVADLVTVESAPLRPGAIDELARVLRPGGRLELSHPVEYAVGAGVHDAMAARLGAGFTRTSTVVEGCMRTVLQGISLLR